MVEMVETMLKLHKDLPKVRTAPDKTVNSFQPTAHGSQLSNQHGTMNDRRRTMSDESGMMKAK
jgi:hypothetical protein